MAPHRSFIAEIKLFKTSAAVTKEGNSKDYFHISLLSDIIIQARPLEDSHRSKITKHVLHSNSCIELDLRKIYKLANITVTEDPSEYIFCISIEF